MGFTENTLKKMKDAVRSVCEKAEANEDAVKDACIAAEKLAVQSAMHRLITNRMAERARSAAGKNPASLIGDLFLSNLRISSLACRWNLMTDLAEAIDRILEEPGDSAPVEEPVAEEVPSEAESVVEEEPVPEEPAVEVFATVEEPAVTENEDGEETEEDEGDEDDAISDVDTSDLEFIDVMEEPERYADMQEQERQGLVRLVSRYRRSFLSRLSQSRGNVQEYYSVVKNALLFYKGVKGRVSWGYESFNRGRVKLAKVNAKSSTLYLYLALNPEELEGTKYFFTDMSSKKKYAATPVLLKIKGERKLKHALELIGKLCGEQNALPTVKNYEIVDYTVPEQTTEELVQAGLVRQFTAAVPVGAFETGIPAEQVATEEPVQPTV